VGPSTVAADNLSGPKMVTMCGEARARCTPPRCSRYAVHLLDEPACCCARPTLIGPLDQTSRWMGRGPSGGCPQLCDSPARMMWLPTPLLNSSMNDRRNRWTSNGCETPWRRCSQRTPSLPTATNWPNTSAPCADCETTSMRSSCGALAVAESWPRRAGRSRLSRCSPTRAGSRAGGGGSRRARARRQPGEQLRRCARRVGGVGGSSRRAGDGDEGSERGTARGVSRIRRPAARGRSHDERRRVRSRVPRRGPPDHRRQHKGSRRRRRTRPATGDVEGEAVGRQAHGDAPHSPRDRPGERREGVGCDRRPVGGGRRADGNARTRWQRM
jgi:hypothetical protein